MSCLSEFSSERYIHLQRSCYTYKISDLTRLPSYIYMHVNARNMNTSEFWYNKYLPLFALVVPLSILGGPDLRGPLYGHIPRYGGPGSLWLCHWRERGPGEWQPSQTCIRRTPQWKPSSFTLVTHVHAKTDSCPSQLSPWLRVVIHVYAWTHTHTCMHSCIEVYILTSVSPVVMLQCRHHQWGYIPQLSPPFWTELEADLTFQPLSSPRFLSEMTTGYKYYWYTFCSTTFSPGLATKDTLSKARGWSSLKHVH